MATVEGLSKVLKVLQDKRAKLQEEAGVSVVVGYTQAYAIYVHENLQAKHPVGQAKFLEQPARTMNSQLSKVIQEGYQKGLSLAKCLLKAGLMLQAASQRLCPVETGALKGSAFTRLEKQ